MLLNISLTSSPNQTFTTTVNGQLITISLYQWGSYMYANITLNGTIITQGARCGNACYINQYFTPFKGYLFFYDTDGEDPLYTTLGGTAQLYYSDYDALLVPYETWLKQQNE